MHIGCCICGWNDTVIDLHHIVPKSQGGSDDNSNLTPLCPNCHRKAHNNLLKPESMLSLQDLFGDQWKSYYYNSDNLWQQPLKYIPKKLCPECGNIIPRFHKTFCSNKCFKIHNQKKSKCPRKEDLQKDVETMGLCDVGKKYNVSHTQIARWCDKLGIQRKKRKSPLKAPVL